MTDTVFEALPDGRVQAAKDPQESLRYWRDVAGLLADGDTISAVTATADGVTLVGTPSFTGTVIVFKISGGTVGMVGSVTLDITTTGGDVLQRSMFFNVRQL
jgi:hypothetical protein